MSNICEFVMEEQILGAGIHAGMKAMTTVCKILSVMARHMWMSRV